VCFKVPETVGTIDYEQVPSSTATPWPQPHPRAFMAWGIFFIFLIKSLFLIMTFLRR
jgi:hypothetical protein